MYDVIVVGAGPAGSTAARLCAAAGLSTLVLEEHATIGYPVQCAGLLSSSAFTECRVSERSVCNTVRGARICGSPGHTLTFDAGTTKAYVVDRGRLDYEMAAAAADAGTEFSLKTCVTGINPQKRTVTTTGIRGHEEIPYQILIAADGPRSIIARGLGIPPSRYIYAGIQAEIPWTGPTELVELHPNASPDFFAWVIPVSPTRARVGLCGTKDIPQRFAAFIRQFPAGTIHEVTGTIPLGIRKRTFGAGCMLIGDAAGFPKPTSGGGVYTGVRSARHAAAVATLACETGDYSDTQLTAYEKAWKADFGRELETGMKALNLRRTLSTDEIDNAIDALNTDEVRNIITGAGDMDRPSALFRKLLTRPEILSTLGVLGVKSMIRSMIN